MLVPGCPHGTFAEVLLRWRDPLFYRLIADRKPFRDGKYPLPDQPGWGFSFDTHYLAPIQNVSARPACAKPASAGEGRSDAKPVTTFADRAHAGERQDEPCQRRANRFSN
jgi:hypothetical protein